MENIVRTISDKMRKQLITILSPSASKIIKDPETSLEVFDDPELIHIAKEIKLIQKRYNTELM